MPNAQFLALILYLFGAYKLLIQVVGLQKLHHFTAEIFW